MDQGKDSDIEDSIDMAKEGEEQDMQMDDEEKEKVKGGDD
jgi:hypothetical protein